MGGGISITENRSIEALNELMAHPNYESIMPLKGESKVSFALRAAAHLVSPPMVEGESNEVECVDVANSILLLKGDIDKRWNNRDKKTLKN